MNAWNVYLNNRLIDTVFYMPNCDHDWVYDSLVNHDGYNPGIVVISSNRTTKSRVLSRIRCQTR